MSLVDKIISAVTPPESAEDRAEARAAAKRESSAGDWLDQIIRHHEQIEAAFVQAETAVGAADRIDAAKTLAALLTGHSSAEEAVIYPQLAEDHKLQMSMAFEEQQAAKVQLALLERLNPESSDWTDKLGHIKGAVAHHVYEEEGSRFLNLKRELPVEAQLRMTARYREEIGRYDSGLRS